MKKFFTSGIAICLVVCSSLVYGQWSDHSNTNTLVCSGNHDRYSKQILSDGSGGLFVCWYEDGSNSPNTVNAQYLNSQGTAQWGANGIAVYSGSHGVEAPAMALDGNGGIFITWKDDDSSNVYGQHLNAAGALQWAANGVNISKDINGLETYEPQMISDGSGGAFVAWDGAFAVVVTRITSSGSVLWKKSVTVTIGGVDARMISDGAGGVIVIWEDDRNSGNGDYGDLYAQRVDANGSLQWTLGGAAVSRAPDQQNYPHLVSDGSNGVIVTWEDFRNQSEFKAYAQRLNGSGQRLWITGSDSNGVALCKAPGTQEEIYIVSDGAGGAICSWDDSRTNDDNIYAQRINASGQVQWDTMGVSLELQSAPQANPKICSDGSGGAIVIWDDNRNNGNNQDIYAQRINGSGSVQWTTNGIAVSSAANNQNLPLIVANPSGGAIAVWDDYRNGGSGNTHPDYYAQTINGQGTLTDVHTLEHSVPQTFELSQNYPNPFNPTTRITFAIPSEGFVSLKVYDNLGREVSTVVSGVKKEGSYTVTFDGSSLASGMYFSRLIYNGKSQMKKMVLVK